MITEFVNAKGRRSILLFRVSGLWTLLAILAALFGALSATVRLLTSFADYDDEEYMLLSTAHYINEGHLYTQTLSHYGPFYFYAQGIFSQLLHLPVTHDMGRLVTLVYWASSSLLAQFSCTDYPRALSWRAPPGSVICSSARSLLMNRGIHNRWSCYFT